MALLQNGFKAIEKGMSQADRRAVINRNFALCFRIIKGDEQSIFVDQMPGVAVVRLGDAEGDGNNGGGGAPNLFTQRYFRLSGQDPTGIADGNGNPVQWLYGAIEVVKAAEGYGETDDAWTTLDGGYVGNAYNFRETGNTGIGVQDNGVNVDGPLVLDRDISMREIRGVVPGHILANDAGELECWFDVTNIMDGSCSSAE